MSYPHKLDCLVIVCGMTLAACSAPTAPTNSPTPTVTPTPLPGAVSLTSLAVDPAAITIGESFTLRWEGFGGAVSLARKGQPPFVVGLPSSGSHRVASGNAGYPSGEGAMVYEAAIGDVALKKEVSLQVQPVPTPTPAPNSPPTVAIASPADGAYVHGTVTVTAQAHDDAGVAGVLFRLDGANLGVEDAQPPYSVAWDTSNSVTGSTGRHTLTAVARDSDGRTTLSAPVSVTVDNTAPTVSITSPTSGQCIDASETATISASASDNDAVAGVWFQANGAYVGSEDTQSPYSASWVPGEPIDCRTLTAVARDSAGNRTVSAPVVVGVGAVRGGGYVCALCP